MRIQASWWSQTQGMVVHLAYGNLNHTLVNALLYHCKEAASGTNGGSVQGLFHCIDKGHQQDYW